MADDILGKILYDLREGDPREGQLRELCDLLERRGTPHKFTVVSGIPAVVWQGIGCWWIAIEDPSEQDSRLAVSVYKNYLTPKEAVEATLGFAPGSVPVNPAFHQRPALCPRCGWVVSDTETTRGK